MKKWKLIASTFLVLTGVLASAGDKTKRVETSHLVFVTEYVRELGATESLRDASEREQRENPDATFSNSIHAGTLFQLEFRSQIRVLKDMRLDAPYEDVIPLVTGFYERKIALWKRMVEISGAFVGGSPKAGIDYDKLAAEVPQIRAGLDYIDKALFDASPLVAMTLLDMRPDSKNHVSHLIITTEERSRLIDHIESRFGPKLDQKEENYVVSTVQVLRDFLRNHKASDEP